MPKPSALTDNDAMARTRRPGLVAAAIGAVVLLSACGDAPPRPAVRPTGEAVLPASPLALPRYDPDQFERLLVSLRGKPVVVNIWASWCGPCREEAPGLARLARAFQGKAQFIGVDIIDHLAPARAFIRKYGWPYPSVFDPTGSIRDDLGFVGQPITVVYDASGRQSFVWSGAVPEEVLRTAVEDVLPA